MTDPLAIVGSYDDLIVAVRARIDALRLSHSLIDDLAGWPSGYCGKIMGPSQVKSIGPVSLGLLLEVLALKIHVVEDPDLRAKMASRYEIRSEISRRVGIVRKPLSGELRARIAREQAQEWGRVGGTAANPYSIDPLKRIHRARKAANARWRKVRRERRAKAMEAGT